VDVVVVVAAGAELVFLQPTNFPFFLLDAFHFIVRVFTRSNCIAGVTCQLRVC
jgi:hypothetical protein